MDRVRRFRADARGISEKFGYSVVQVRRDDAGCRSVLPRFPDGGLPFGRPSLARCPCQFRGMGRADRPGRGEGFFRGGEETGGAVDEFYLPFTPMLL